MEEISIVNETYAEDAPDRAEVDRLEGPTLIEFGSPWCGYCRAAQPSIAVALQTHPDVRHLKIVDGPGRALGRSFRVKLWPTLVFMKDGREVTKLVRPNGSPPIVDALARIAAVDVPDAKDAQRVAGSAHLHL